MDSIKKVTYKTTYISLFTLSVIIIFKELIAMATFGERFKQLRKEKNLTQEKLAEMFYTKKSSISRYENNLQIPEFSKVIFMCFSSIPN